MMFYLKLMKPYGVDQIDKVEDEVSKERNDDERFPAISVRYWASEQSEHYPRHSLQDGTVGLTVGESKKYLGKHFSLVHLHS